MGRGTSTLSSRIIHESCRTSETLDGLSDFAERLFWRLTTVADDFGRFNAHPRIVLGGCFPLKVHQLSEDDILQALAEMQSVGILRLYTNRDKRLAEFVTWDIYQRIRATNSKFPASKDEGSQEWNVGAHIRRHSRTTADNGGQPLTSADALYTQDIDLNPPDPSSVLSPSCSQEPRDSESGRLADVPKPKPLVLSAAVKEAKKRLCRIPKDLELTPHFVEQAVKVGLSDPSKMKFEFEKFLDHYRGSGGLKADWVAAWRNWCRKAINGFGDVPARASPEVRPRRELSEAMPWEHQH